MSTKDLHPGLGSGALREALRQATETLRVYTAMIPDQRIELEIKQYDALLSLPSPIEPALEMLAKLYHAVSMTGFGHDVKAQKQRLADALKEAGTLLAEFSPDYAEAATIEGKREPFALERPTPQASSEIWEARVAAFNEAIDAINGVCFAFERSGWADALERVIKLRNAALAKEQAGNE